MINKKHICIVALKPNKDLIFMNKLFEAGKVKPIIDGSYQLEEMHNAFRTFLNEDHKGKVVLTM
jgi:NADPH:quinone reductase-like Zn-dependent oxidoreductase